MNAKTKPETQYMVLVASGPDAEWRVVGQAKGANDKAAIRDALESSDVDGDTFVAVPLRSWRLRRRRVEQVTRESWS